MPVTASTCLQACLQVQEALDAKVPEQISPDKRPISDLGAQAALRAAGNRGVFEAQEARNAFGGKGLPDGSGAPQCLTYELQYVTPQCGATQTGVPGVCDVDSAASTKSCVEVQVDDYNHDGGVISVSDFDCICDNPPVGEQNFGTPLGRLAYDIKQTARRIIADQNTILITDMIAQGGAFHDATTFAIGKPLNITNAAGGVNVSELVNINNELRLQRFDPRDYIVLGGSLWAEFADRYALMDGCCTDDGLRTGGLNPNYYDLEVDTVFAANDNIIAWVPGAYQLIDWTVNSNYRAYDVGTEIATTVMIDGIEFDYWMKFDCGAWTWHLGKGTDLFALPQAVYTACNAGNGRLHYTVNCGAAAC